MAKSHGTTMKVARSTLDRLDAIGARGESYEQILLRLLDAFVAESPRSQKVRGR